MTNGSKGSTPVAQKFLDTGDLFGLRYSEGIVFCEVDSWEQIKFAPFEFQGEVNPQTNTQFEVIEDDSSDEILFSERRSKMVKHVGIGHKPARLRRYTNYPESEIRLRRINNIGAPSPGDNFGYVDGYDTPYNNPTDAEELVIPPGQSLDFAFYNPTTEAQVPTLNILMRQYRINPLDPSNDSDANAISRVVSPGSPMPIYNVGGVNRHANYDLREHWGVRPISRKRAQSL